MYEHPVLGATENDIGSRPPHVMVKVVKRGAARDVINSNFKKKSSGYIL